MHLLSFFVTPLSIFLSLSTATGIFLHDTRVDKATLSVLSTPSSGTSYQANTKLVNYATDSHTHVERHSFSQSLHELRGDTPRIPPRAGHEKKYVTQKNLGLGHNPFDSYALPLA
jgi:hypothetical protein